MNIILNNPPEQSCPEEEHDWEYKAGDYDVGINAGWECKECGATHDGPPPEDDFDAWNYY